MPLVDWNSATSYAAAYDIGAEPEGYPSARPEIDEIEGTVVIDGGGRIPVKNLHVPMTEIEPGVESIMMVN